MPSHLIISTTLILLIAISSIQPTCAGDTPATLWDGIKEITTISINGFDIRVYEADTNGRPGGYPTDTDRKLLLGPICGFLRDPAARGIRFVRRIGPGGYAFFDIPIVLHAPGVRELAAAEINRVKGWGIDPQNVLWLELTAVSVVPEYADLFGEGIRAEMGREGFIHTRDVEVVTFAVRSSGADAFERALVEGHNFVFRYEARGRDPITAKIEIRAKDLVEIGFLRDLKGPSGERYVTRVQVLELLDKATHELSIRRWVDLDVPPEILREMIQGAFDNLTAAFWKERELQMKELSLTELGKLRLDPNDPSFTPDLLRRMAVEFHTKDARELLEKYHTELRDVLHNRQENSSSGKSGGSASFLKLFGGSGSHESNKSRVDDSTKEEERLLDLVNETKANVERSFRLEKEGEFWVAKSIFLYDTQDLRLDGDRTLSDEVVIDRRGFRTDPYKRNTREDFWAPSVELLLKDPRLEPLLRGGR